MKKTIELKVPYKDINSVRQALKESKVKHWPFKREWPGYVVTIEDGPMSTFFALKFTNT
jgi:hypothetical protein